MLRRECLTCGLVDKIFSTPTGHSFDAVVTPPTCTEEGYTVHTCSFCGDVSIDEIVPSTGHDYQAMITDPTCTEEGFTTYICHCGDNYVTDEVPATGHSWSEWNETAPGIEERTCEICGETESRERISAT
jgi:hypothetical protein